MKETLKWIAGIACLLASLTAITNLNILGFLCLLIAGIFCLPPTLKWIELKLFKSNISSFQKYLFVVLSLFVGGVSLSDTKNLQPNVNQQSGKDSEKDAVTDSLINLRKNQREKLMISFDSLAKANALRINKDEFKPDVVFYFPDKAPKYRNTNWMFPYLGKSGNSVYLRYVIQYEADDWLFIENVKVKTKYEDGSEKIIDLFSGYFDRDNESARIWEWTDIEVSEFMYQNLMDIYNAKSAKIRFQGRQYYKERNMTSNEFKALKNVINVYKQVTE